MATKVRQSDVARGKLLDATIALIAERGLSGFSLADVGDRAGVSRALAGYHFKSSHALRLGALARVYEDEPDAGGRGLTPMLEWVQAQVRRAAAGDRRLSAMLQVAIGPGVDPEVLGLREAHRARQTDLLWRHLSSARAAQQISQALDPVQTAALILGLMHGEQLRVIATGDPLEGAFIGFLERALAAPLPTRANRIRHAREPISRPDELFSTDPSASGEGDDH